MEQAWKILEVQNNKNSFTLLKRKGLVTFRGETGTCFSVSFKSRGISWKKRCHQFFLPLVTPCHWVGVGVGVSGRRS